MSKYGVTHYLSTAYHPQTSGQVEVINRGLKRILKRTVGKNRALWSDKLEDVLWAFRTAFKTPVGCTPYRLKIFLGKLKSRWSGPFTISETYPYGTAKLTHSDGSNFKVNCHRLKHYHRGDLPPLEIPDDFSPVNEVFLCWIFVRFPKSPYPLIDSSLEKSISFDLYCLAVIFPPLCSNCKH
nr:reverse transcriptase domain-containing protein [Tanacetum cinerariifolium]